jgi:formylglycine-generating enzyme required for sulfatase activity
MGDLFIVAAQEEDKQVARLQNHLVPVARAAGLRVAASTEILAGEERLEGLRRGVRESRVVVLLVTASLLASEEGEAAIEEALRSRAAVVPVLLGACTWKLSVLGKLQWVPRDMMPIAARSDPDSAWVEVAEAVMGAAEVAAAAQPAAAEGPQAAAREGEAPSEGRALNEVRVLEDRLEAARSRRENLRRVSGTEAALRLDSEILELRRKLRERGQLAAGDGLAKDRYVLVERLGKGGFATVWRAHDEHTGTAVAVKVLHSQFVRDEQRRERFFRGARVMASLSHPGIVRVLEAGGHDRGFDYFVMELLRGGTLRDAVLEGRLSETAMVEVLWKVSRALGAAHAVGHVHRDVKPANVLLDEQGNPKLTDFDLVGGVHTTGGTRTGAMGTFMYSAPETMTRPQDADARADVYGLGMTGVFCFHGKDLPPAVMRDAGRVIRALRCSAEVQAALVGATEWEVEDRFSDVGVFADALRARPEPQPPSRPPAPASAAAGSPVAQPVTPVRTGTFAPPRAALSTRQEPALTAKPEPGSLPWVPDQREDSSGWFASFVVGNVVQRMRWVPAGTFRMGSPPEEVGRDQAEGPQHEVALTRGFWLANTPCTQALWQEVMGENPSQFRSPERPVEQVSWKDCRAFLAALNERVPGLAARLPSEAEWEYACRAGTETATWAGDLQILGTSNAPVLDAIAWYTGNSGHGFELADGYDSRPWPEKQYPHTRAGTRPVGQKLANPLGLFDMLGNVYEWCNDWVGPYAAAAAVDPTGPAAGSDRVFRGGSWVSDAGDVRAAFRLAAPPEGRYDDVGFRFARGQEPSPEAGAGPLPNPAGRPPGRPASRAASRRQRRPQKTAPVTAGWAAPRLRARPRRAPSCARARARSARSCRGGAAARSWPPAPRAAAAPIQWPCTRRPDRPWRPMLRRAPGE